MTTVHAESGTNVHEIAAGIFRISVPVPPSAMPGGFTFNQFLLVDDEPLLFHTGPHKMFPLVRQAVAHVLGDVTKLRWVGFSHVEADECGVAQRVARGGAPGRAGLQPGRGDGVGERLRDPAGPCARGRRGAVAREQARALVRCAAPAAQLGVRLPLRVDDADAPLRGSLHARRRRRPADHRVGGARPVRGLPPGDAGRQRGDRAGEPRDPREAGGDRADDPRAHARQLLPRRRREAPAGARRRARAPEGAPGMRALRPVACRDRERARRQLLLLSPVGDSSRQLRAARGGDRRRARAARRRPW